MDKLIHIGKYYYSMEKNITSTGCTTHHTCTNLPINKQQIQNKMQSEWLASSQHSKNRGKNISLNMVPIFIVVFLNMYSIVANELIRIEVGLNFIKCLLNSLCWDSVEQQKQPILKIFVEICDRTSKVDFQNILSIRRSVKPSLTGVSFRYNIDIIFFVRNPVKYWIFGWIQLELWGSSCIFHRKRTPRLHSKIQCLVGLLA